MSSHTSENKKEASEIQDDIAEFIFDEQRNSTNTYILEETLYPSNPEDIKEQNVENNNSELSGKSTDVVEVQKEEKKKDSKNLLENNDINKPYNNGISPQKNRNKIKRQLSLSLKNYIKSQLKTKISRKNLKILLKKKEIIHKLLEIVKQHKNIKIHTLKKILIRTIKKLLKKYMNYKRPKKSLESGNLTIYSINNLSDSLDILFWKNQNISNNDEILNENEASKLADISCNKEIYNRIDNEASYMIEDNLYMYFPPFENLGNTNYTTI